MSEETNKKVKKKKGIIRTEAILFVLIISALTSAYTYFFFDSHLKRALALAASYGVGAEVNIGSLKTSFINPSVFLNEVQITNKDKLDENILSIDKLGFQLSMDALLRAKLVITQSSLENIQTGSKRKKPGKIYKKKAEKKISEIKEVKELKESALEETKKQYSDNVLGDLASLAQGGSDKYLSDLKNNSAANDAFENLKKEIDSKELQWKKRIDNLPQSKEIDKIFKEIKSTKISKSPIKALKDISNLNKLIKKANGILKEYNSAQKDLRGDSKYFKKEISSLEKKAKSELNNLKNKASIPGLDADSLTKAVFMRFIMTKFANYMPYYNKAKKYLPPPKKKGDKKEKKLSNRMIGRNVIFPITTGYPLFWLQKLIISSNANTNPLSANASGILTNLSSHPKRIKEPAILDLKASFPGANIEGIKALLTIDHRSDNPFEELNLLIGKLPSQNISISKSDALSVVIEKADINAAIRIYNTTASTKLTSTTYVKNGKYQVDAKSSFIKDVFDQSLNTLDTLGLSANATGKIPNLDWSIKSNLGKELTKNIKAQVNNKIKAAQKKLRSQTLGRIEEQKKDIKSKLNSFTSKFDNILGKNKKKAKEATKLASGKSKKSSGSSSKDTKKDVKKLLKKFF